MERRRLRTPDGLRSTVEQLGGGIEVEEQLVGLVDDLGDAGVQRILDCLLEILDAQLRV